MVSIPVRVQHRHVHLSPDDYGALFGDEKQKTFIDLDHRGQFISPATVSVMGKKGILDQVYVFGPCRRRTQVELSATDAYALGIDAPLRLSGDLGEAGSCKIKGPNGHVETIQTVIIPARHLHCSDRDAARLGISHNEMVSVAPINRKGQVIDHVSVRVHPTFSLSFHINSDESATYWLADTDQITII